MYPNLLYILRTSTFLGPKFIINTSKIPPKIPKIAILAILAKISLIQIGTVSISRDGAGWFFQGHFYVYKYKFFHKI